MDAFGIYLIYVGAELNLKKKINLESLHFISRVLNVFKEISEA